MNWLYWKDYRHNRVVVSSVLFFMLVPHLFALYALCWNAHHGHYRPGEWPMYFGAAALYGFFFSQLCIAVLGGNAFAGERTDRSAEFLASLPVSRAKIVASKLLFSLTVVVAIWLIGLAALCSLWAADPTRVGLRLPQGEELAWILGAITWTAVVSATFFCVAWCLSAFLRSPTFATLGGLITPTLVWTGILLVGYMLGFEVDHPPPPIWWTITSAYRWICVALAASSFAIGTWHYLRRVEP